MRSYRHNKPKSCDYNESWSQEQTDVLASLKQQQLKYEELLMPVIESLDQQALLRKVEFKECEALSSSIGRLLQRWKRLNVMSIEAVVELRYEAERERSAIDVLYEEINQFESKNSANKQQLKEMQQLCELLDHFIKKKETNSPRSLLI